MPTTIHSVIITEFVLCYIRIVHARLSKTGFYCIAAQISNELTVKQNFRNSFIWDLSHRDCDFSAKSQIIEENVKVKEFFFEKLNKESFFLEFPLTKREY